MIALHKLFNIRIGALNNLRFIITFIIYEIRVINTATIILIEFL